MPGSVDLFSSVPPGQDGLVEHYTRWRRTSVVIQPKGRLGYTLVEMLVSIGIIALLLALLLPAVQQARESARLTICRNNLKQIGLAIHNYHETFSCFPVGGMCQPGRAKGLPAISTVWPGVSFWVRLLPHLDQSSLFAAFDTSSPASGDLQMGPNGPVANNVSLAVLQCPSSTLPSPIRIGIYYTMTPSYVGISGASTSSTYSGVVFDEPRTQSFPVCSGYIGKMSWGGMLLANQMTQMSDVADGSSNVLIVGESSDFARGTNNAPQRPDGGFPSGWTYSTLSGGTMGNYKNQANVATRCLNLTTIMHPIGTRQLPVPDGCYTASPNRPLISPHTGGASVLFTDGAVRFLGNSTDLTTLKQLSTRDDGKALGNF